MRLVLILVALILAGLTGCTVEDNSLTSHEIVYDFEDYPPAAPRGLASITGDQQVILYWYANREPDISYYNVYYSRSYNGTYELVASLTDTVFYDYDVANGVTYYYAVTAVDDYGNESDFNYSDITHDTPRPEGYNALVYDIDYNSIQGGFDFSSGSACDGFSPVSDIFYSCVPQSGYYYIKTCFEEVDIQDFGYTESLDDVNYSPCGENAGWSMIGEVEAIVGHSYIVWTAEDHYAKFRISSITNDYIVIDWAYQVDPGNPELNQLAKKEK